jgi:hypothetical protein
MGPDHAAPSFSWARQFSRSLDEFKVANSQPISAQRVINSSVEHIDDWFKKADEVVRPGKRRPELFFNMDETMLDSTARKIRVIVPKESLPIRLNSSESEGMHITLVFCIAADGEHMKPSLVLPLKQFPISLAEVADKFHWAGQSAGWMTAEIFKNWAINAFIPHVNARRVAINCPNEAALLIVDSHESRRSPDALQALKDANIDVFTFPSHTSHILQPLDCGVNRAFKMKIRASRSMALHTTVDQRRLQLIKIAARSSYDAMYPDTILQAWAAAGIHPWNVETMKGSPYALTNLPPEIAQKTLKRKRTAITLSEKLITSDEVINSLKMKDKSRDEPKKPRGRPRKKPALEPPAEDNIGESVERSDSD